MNKNMGNIDRALRITGSVVIGILLVTGIFHGLRGIILGIVAIVWLITGIIRWCPVYAALGISTGKRDEQKRI